MSKSKLSLSAMAAAGSEFLEKIKENFLVCGICSERYQKAKVLLCLHSFCEQCLRDLVEKTGRLDCPVCRRSHKLPQGGVANLQRNFFLDNIVKEFNRHDPGSFGLVCDGCLGEGGENDIRCLDCSAKLCERCARAHNRLPVTRSHRLIDIDEYHCMSKKEPSTIQPGIYCELHTDSQVEFYCNTCEVPICSDCTVIDHRVPEHEHRHLQDAAEDLKQVVERTLKQLKVKENENDDSKGAVQEMVSKLDVSFRGEEKKLTDHVTETVKLTEEHGRQLLEQLSDEYKARKDDLTAQLKALDVVEHDVVNTRKLAEDLVMSGNDVQLMSAKRGLAAQTKEILQPETKTNPVAPEFIEFEASDVFHENTSLGTVLLLRYTLSDVPRYCRIGEELRYTFCVQGTAESGSPFAEILSPTDETQKMIVQCNTNRTFLLRGSTKMEGEHRVQVHYCEQLVFNLPLKVVRPKGFLFEFGNGHQGSGEGMNWPFGIALDKERNLVVCEYGKGVITRFFLPEDKLTLLSKCVKRIGPYKPQYVAISADQTLRFVTEEVKKEVLVFNKNLRFVRRFKGNISNPRGIAVSQINKRVYIADSNSHCIHVCDKSGGHIKSFGGRIAGNLFSPEGICVDTDGKVIVSDWGKHCVQVFDADGKFLFAFGSEGHGEGQMRNPFGVTTDKQNNVYVCDYGNARVVKYDPDGNYICRIDNGEIRGPRDVCVSDDEPLVIVSDGVDNCIKVFVQ